MTTINLDAAEAAELAEILETIIDCLDQLPMAQHRTLPLTDQPYTLADLRADLDRHKTQLLTAKTHP